MESITAYIRPTQTFGGLGNHMWVVYTNSSGKQYSLSGWSNTQGSILSGWGSLDTQVSDWGPRSWDWADRSTATGSEVIAQGESLSASWNSMITCAVKIDSANIQYGPLGVNSNSVINTCLLWAGLNPVSIDSSLPGFGFWTPGSDLDLRSLNLDYKRSPDEPGPPTNQLSLYDITFGFGGGGTRFSGFEGNFGGGTISIFGGNSGHWVFAGAGLEGSVSYGWVWVEDTATHIKPVVLDLDGDGLELTSSIASPGFDFFGNGYAKASGWFNGGDGLLVFDANLNGLVDNGAEISFLHQMPGSSTDLQALAAFDTNGNSWLDAGDSEYAKFRVWRDSNFNGRTDTGELQTLSAVNVASISLSPAGGTYGQAGNAIYGTAAFTRVSGGNGIAYDVGFESFSRGGKYITAAGSLSLLEFETGERMVAAQPGAGAFNITNATNYTFSGYTVHGFQLGNGADSVANSGAASKPIYVDGGGGNDTINLSQSYWDNVIKGGAGDDTIWGGRTNDVVSPGSSVYGDIVNDLSGNDYYVLEAGSIAYVDDSSGVDVAVFNGYSSNQLSFFRHGFYGADTLFVGTTDGAISLHLSDMYVSSAKGIEYLVLSDTTLTREQLLALGNNSGFMTADTQVMQRVFNPDDMHVMVP